MLICEEAQKSLKLLELLGIYYEQGSSIIFVDKQEKVGILKILNVSTLQLAINELKPTKKWGIFKILETYI